MSLILKTAAKQIIVFRECSNTQQDPSQKATISSHLFKESIKPSKHLTPAFEDFDYATLKKL